MVQPISYQLPGVSTDPFASLVEGLKLGATVEDIQSARAQRELNALKLQQQLRQQQATFNAVANLQDKARAGTATWEDYQNVVMAAPKDQAEAALKMWEAKSKDMQQQDLLFGQQVMAAFGSKDPQIGIDLLQKRADAAANAGRVDEAKAWETWKKIAELDPTEAQWRIGSFIGGLPGGDKAIEAFTKTQQERRSQELFPTEQAIKKADQTIKDAQAKYAPEKFGAELGLTNAQIDQAKAAAAASRAATEKSEAERKKLEKEAEQLGIGIIPLDKRTEAERNFRKEYFDATKVHREVKDAYGRVLSSQDTAVGDLSLIFGYMKMLDPGSVVREGEFATAQNAAGVPERIQNIYNRVISGERLTTSQRGSFKNQAKTLYGTSQQAEKIIRSGIERIATGYGLSPTNIFYEPTETAPVAPSTDEKPVATKPSAEFTATAPNGQVYRFPTKEAADQAAAAFRQLRGQ